MKIVKYLFFSIIALSSLKAQTTSEVGVWIDHLPYGAGVAVVQVGDLVYSASEQGLFIFSKVDRDIKRISKLSGLSDINITDMAYAESRDEIIIGYANANIDILKGDQVTNISDITLSANFPGLKTINHLYPYGDLVYMSTDFGIVVLDLEQEIIKETYIIGPKGATVRVNEVVINPDNDSIYAATELGLFSSSLNEQLQFFERWNDSIGFTTEVEDVTIFQGEVLVNKKGDNGNDSIFYRRNGQWIYASEIPEANYFHVRESQGVLLVCNGFSVAGYDQNFAVQYNVVSGAVEDQTGVPGFRPQAAVIDDGAESVWIVDDGDGLFLNFQKLFIQNFNPNSPVTKKINGMHTNQSILFMSPGEIDPVWSPQFNNSGFSVLNDFTWDNVSNTTFDEYKDIVEIMSDPNDVSHYFLSAYGSGIVEFQDNQFVRIINSASVTEEVLPSLGGSGNHRIGGFAYDPDGNLWFTNSLTDRPLGVLRADGTVQSYGVGSAGGSGVPVKDIMFTTLDQIWMQTRTSGIIVGRFTNGQLETKRMTSTENAGNLPTERVLSFAEDKDGEIWIGTDEGVAVLFSPQNLFEPNRNFDAQRIIIDEDGDGLGDPFLGGEEVNDIEVDGSNKKWFATSNSGAFYTSTDGREEIYHFTSSNSPLISNNVLDIEIDDETGVVYFGTDQGLVAFQGVATEGSDFNEDVYAYPNPVEPGYTGPILIRGLVTNAQVKITDIEGNIVFETVAEGGQALWSGNSFDGVRAKSGVYLAYITNDLGSATEVTKILIVN
jgi:sugar lactone lactonase YvrE